MCYTFHKDAYLSRCFQGCKAFERMEEAMAYCARYDGCGGVTYSRDFHGRNPRGWAFECRAGSRPIRNRRSYRTDTNHREDLE